MCPENLYPQLTAALITARSAIESVLLQIAEEKPTAEALDLKNAATGECAHRDRQAMMGGHWWCPTCGATG